MTPDNASGGTEQPEVVCLCGSTRFKDEYRAENRRLTMEGKIVLSVGLFGHADGHEFSDEEKEMLDALHKRKIDLADRIHVINVDGYVGDSTQSEIEYARGTGTQISYLERTVATDGGVDNSNSDTGQLSLFISKREVLPHRHPSTFDFRFISPARRRKAGYKAPHSGQKAVTSTGIARSINYGSDISTVNCSFLSRTLQPDTAPDRAQVDPRALGILVLLVGLLFMAAISVGVMFP